MERRARRKRGNAAVTAVSLATLLGFGAIAVDVSYIRVTNAQLQVALEAGVLGGSGYLDGTVDGVDLAKTKTVQLVDANPVFGGLNVTTADVVLGHYDFSSDDPTFEVRSDPADDDDAREINALRLNLTHTGLRALLAGIAFGQHELSTAAMATAVRDLGGPAGAVDCYLPIIVPHCMFDENMEVNPPPIRAYVQTDSNDNSAWAAFDGSANMNSVNGLLRRTNCGAGAELGDEASLNNGVGNAMSTVGGILNGTDAVADPLPWPAEQFPAGPPSPRGGDENYSFATNHSHVSAANWGNVIGGPIALVDVGGTPGNCPANPKMVGGAKIMGFAYGYIYDSRGGSAHETGAWIQLDFVNEYKLGDRATGGGEAVGNVEYPPKPGVLIP